MRKKIAAALGITTRNLTTDEQSASSKKAAGHFGAGGFFSPILVREIGGFRPL
ncbi:MULTISPECIES: hypothetical protein [Burkholderia cepacia complex]|nr:MULTISPECIES: hypothetical protein [Burkholderia cepacia complex]